jgi:hypothetical protein
MFARRRLTDDVVRGAIGGASLLGTMVLMPDHPILALAGVPIALVALRICSTCWLVALAITLAERAQGRPPTREASQRLAREGEARHQESP